MGGRPAPEVGDRGGDPLRSRDPVGLVGRGLAALIGTGLAAASAFYAFIVAIWGPPDDGRGVELEAKGLAVSIVCGLAAVGCARLAAGRRGVSWWLLVGLFPATACLVRWAFW